MAIFREARRSGLTRVEFIVLATIVLVALGLVGVWVKKARDADALTTTLNNLREIGEASHGAHDTYKKFPPFYGWYNGKLGSIHAHILPHIKGTNIYQRFPDGDTLQTAASLGAFPPYASPLDPSSPAGVFPGPPVGTTSYICNANAFWFTGTGSLPGKGPTALGLQRMPASFMNGTSNAVFFATACGNASATADGPAAGDVKGNHNYSNGYAYFPNLSPKNELPNVADAAGEHGWTRPGKAAYPVPGVLNGNRTAVWRQPTQLTVAGSQVCMGDASTRTVSPTIVQETWGTVCDTSPPPLRWDRWEP